MKNFFKKLLSSKSQSKYFSETVQRVGKNNAGFSLVELIVVIAIMAVLAAVAVIGVSIYIPKAQEATDNELLNVLTDALVAACLSEGVDQREITATIAVDQQTGKLAMNGTDIAIQISGTSKADEIADLFNDVVTDKNAKFNIINGTRVKFENGKFGWDKGTNSVYDGLEFSKDDIDAIKNSNFGELGAEVLLGRIDLATDILNQLATGEHVALQNKVNSMLLNPDNMITLAAYLGYTDLSDPEQEQAFAEEYSQLIEKKVAMLKEIYGDSKLEHELYTMAEAEILSNNAVLIAATKSDFNKDEFVLQMGNGTAKQAILDNLAGTNEQVSTALSQSAMVYGMYTSYAALKGIEIDDDFDVNDVLSAMDDPDFQQYMKNESAKDVDAYNSAMNMINTSSQNSDAVKDVLLNGFDNENLSDLMGDALK